MDLVLRLPRCDVLWIWLLCIVSAVLRGLGMVRPWVRCSVDLVLVRPWMRCTIDLVLRILERDAPLFWFFARPRTRYTIDSRPRLRDIVR